MLPDGMFPKPSLVLCDRLMTCATERLEQLMGIADDVVMRLSTTHCDIRSR
jgi:hypothetical protein